MPVLPIGTVVLWSGAIVDIPTGWQLSDGTNGTPDLRGRFVVGAGSTYSPDETGGDIQHDHDFTSDGHNHVIVPGLGLADGVDSSKTTTTAVDTGTTDADASLPLFYALAYIIRI